MLVRQGWAQPEVRGGKEDHAGYLAGDRQGCDHGAGGTGGLAIWEQVD